MKFRLPAGEHEVYADEAAVRMVGQEFNLTVDWDTDIAPVRMVIVGAELVDGGAAVEIDVRQAQP